MEDNSAAFFDESDAERDQLEEQLHRLDREIHQIRQRIIYLKRGAIPVGDPETEIAALERNYLHLADQFSALYRSWQEMV